MATIQNDFDLEKTLRATIRSELTKAAEVEIDRLVDEVRLKLRARVAEMVVAMLDRHYSAERDGHILLIRVSLKTPDGQ